jgi:hypothetical protein
MRGQTRGLLILLMALAILTIALNIYGSSLNVYHVDSSSLRCDEVYSSAKHNTESASFGLPERRKSLQIIKTNVNITSTPPRIFHCGGYALNRNFHPTLRSLFPEYQWQDLSTPNAPRVLLREKQVTYLHTHPWDIFVTNWLMNECSDDEVINRWLHIYFEGKILFLNPEDATRLDPPIPRPHHYELGPGPPPLPSKIYPKEHHVRRHVFYFLQAAFWAQLNLNEKQLLLDPSNTLMSRSQSTGQHFLIYAHSHCVGIRQKAFRQIANLEFSSGEGGNNNENNKRVAYYGGLCNGGVSDNNKAQAYPNKVRLKNWEDNRHVYKDFRFCLVMEHINAPGYITEKILVAFWAGCVPVYYGTTEIFDIFHRDSFIYYNVMDPQPALNQLQYLEANKTAYQEMLRHPILVKDAAKKFFSLGNEIGGGFLKAEIRSFLGLDEFSFT